jgi:hypothetical protein
MKTTITLTVLFALHVFQGFSSNYEEVMKTNIDNITGVKSFGEMNELASRFERIANAEQDKWLPGYYAAYCFVQSTFMEKMESEQVHQQLDKAQNHIDKLLKTYDEESEIYALQALVYQLRITDMSKGYKFSKMSNEALGLGEKLNPKNPRIYYLRGSNTFHTPKMFGGGAEKAKPYLEKAAEMFADEKPKNKLLPVWGSAHNNELLKMCTEDS